MGERLALGALQALVIERAGDVVVALADGHAANLFDEIAGISQAVADARATRRRCLRKRHRTSGRAAEADVGVVFGR